MFAEIISLAAAGSCFLADQKSKKYIEEHYELKRPVQKNALVSIERMENRGFAGSRMEDRRGLVLTVTTVVSVLLLIAYGLVLVKSGSKMMKIGLGILLGGAAGNIYDRWKKSYVTDFINLSFYKKIIFNIADICIVVGSIMILIADMTGGKA